MPRFLILGGGMVAGYAAKQMADSGLKPGDLTIISADTSIPYERPPLSKGFLAGRETAESIQINPDSFYSEHGIDVKLRTRVTGVNVSGKRLSLEDGAELPYERLVIATGAQPRTLEIPGAGLARVHYLRSMDDSGVIRHSADNAKKAVVIGSGFIGMEVASVLAQKNIETTMVLRDERIWKQFFTPEMSRFFEGYYAARGVRFVKSAVIRELRGDGNVASTVLADGQAIPCDMVVAGIGVTPVTDVLANSGIKLDNGVLVNEYLETSATDVLAAGDVANYNDVLFQKRRRVEHWDNAVSQGQHCAKLLLGERSPFVHVPYFFSDVFDLSYEFWGDPSGAEQVVHRGDLSTNSFSVWWLRAGVLVAAFVMNRPDEERESAPKWIEEKRRVNPTGLAKASESLSGL